MNRRQSAAFLSFCAPPCAGPHRLPARARTPAIPRRRHQGIFFTGPNGKIFTAGYGGTWRGGAEYKTDNGGFIARYDRFEAGFGDPVKCVAADAEYVFWRTPEKGTPRSAHGGGGAGAYTRGTANFTSARQGQ